MSSTADDERPARSILQAIPVYFRRLYWLMLVLPFCDAGQEHNFELYDQAQGLSNILVQDVAFDKYGFLWVATRNGLC